MVELQDKSVHLVVTSPPYWQLKEKIEANKKGLFKGVNFEIQERKNKITDFKSEILKLPYIFKDSIKFSRKIDPKKLQFGSKIDINDFKIAVI